MPLIEYERGTTFPGVIGRTVAESSPAWPKPLRAKEGSPNVIFFVLDDVGYGQMSAFGGLVNTPNIDRIAREGIDFTDYYAQQNCTAGRAAFTDQPGT